MSPTSLKEGPDLAIQVDCPSKTYNPGSVITGRVIRTKHAVSPMAVVEVRLHGRAKSKIAITRSNGQSTYTTYYRGRFNFLDDSTASEIYNGPLHIASDAPGETWPFAIHIPSNISPGALLSGHSDQKSSFLSLAPDSIASSPLPGSFAATGRQFMRSVSFGCYVEYHLEAVLLQQSSHGSSSTATLPLNIQPRSGLCSSTSLDLKRQTQGSSISTYRLVPGMEDAHLSLKQKTQKLFHSSKVPGLHFTFHVDTPGIIQLKHPSPVPFRISLVADRLNSSEVVCDAPQTALVTSLELILEAHTYVIAPGSLRSRSSTYKSNDSVKHKFMLPIRAPVVARPSSSKSMGSTGDPDCLPEYEQGDHPGTTSEKMEALPGYSSTPSSEALMLPISWEQGGSQMLDIGSVLDLHIHSNGASASGIYMPTNPKSHGICPGFTTYCIKHYHTLGWKISLMIAGESVRFEGGLPVSVLGPSQSVMNAG